MTQIYTRPGFSSFIQRSPTLEERGAQDRAVKDPYTTSRDYQKPDQASLYRSERLNEGNPWEVSQPRSISVPKKGLYDAPSSKAGDMYQSKPEVTPNPPREQLPPLSSLFGSSSSHQSRPAQSPYSDRDSPVFPAVSQLDARHPATSIHPDRQFDGSYFQRPTASHQYSYNSKSEQERLGFQPPPRPNQSSIRPESPRNESRFTPTETPRSLPSSSVNGWTTQSYAPRTEYFSRDTSSSFRPHSEHRPPPPLSRPDQDPRPSYHAPITPTYPPTPASTVGDQPATKDGLGPKIWTGTQFLPRFVRQAEVPGEGMCYFYDDGTHCKTVIDGEVVNAHWGVTKAGKPRKRLAIACITCREKKIKCDPDYPRCVQCEKFGRVCKFKNAPRGGQGSPDTPPADLDDILPRPASSRSEGESFKVEQREDSHSVSPRQTLRRASPVSEPQHNKRQRIGYSEFTPVASEGSPRPSVLEPTSPSTPWIEPLVASPTDHNLMREWRVNPFRTQPALVTELVTVFFKHVPETAYCMFPEGPFKAWVLSLGEKSLDDLMLIYTILALGTVFSPKSKHKGLGLQYAAISRYACDNRHFSIQLVQSRLILALYYFAVNNPNDSWDFCGAALRAASGLRMNVDFEKSEDAFLKTFPYGLNRSGYAECRRRTFWSCYLMDRYNGFCSGHLSVIHAEDVFLRLPCDLKSFENQADVQNPFFDGSTPPIQNINWTIGSMAYLINISTIWGDVMANIYRTSQRPVPLASNAAFVAFYDRTLQRLREWKDSLPQCYQFSAECLKRASDSGKLGTYMMMHSVYHSTAMKLNRYVQKSTLTIPQINHHISIAKQHAEEFLSIMDTLAGSRSMPSPISINAPSNMEAKFSSPFIGNSIVSAIDILTAKFTPTSIPTRLASFSGSQSILAELALFWQSAKNQQALVLQRVGDMAELTTGRDAPGSAGTLGSKLFNITGIGRENPDGSFEMREAIEKTFSRDYDCFYA